MADRSDERTEIPGEEPTGARVSSSPPSTPAPTSPPLPRSYSSPHSISDAYIIITSDGDEPASTTANITSSHPAVTELPSNRTTSTHGGSPSSTPSSSSSSPPPSFLDVEDAVDAIISRVHGRPFPLHPRPHNSESIDAFTPSQIDDEIGHEIIELAISVAQDPAFRQSVETDAHTHRIRALLAARDESWAAVHLPGRHRREGSARRMSASNYSTSRPSYDHRYDHDHDHDPTLSSLHIAGPTRHSTRAFPATTIGGTYSPSSSSSSSSLLSRLLHVAHHGVHSFLRALYSMIASTWKRLHPQSGGKGGHWTWIPTTSRGSGSRSVLRRGLLPSSTPDNPVVDVHAPAVGHITSLAFLLATAAVLIVSIPSLATAFFDSGPSSASATAATSNAASTTLGLGLGFGKVAKMSVGGSVPVMNSRTLPAFSPSLLGLPVVAPAVTRWYLYSKWARGRALPVSSWAGVRAASRAPSTPSTPSASGVASLARYANTEESTGTTSGSTPARPRVVHVVGDTVFDPLAEDLVRMAWSREMSP